MDADDVDLAADSNAEDADGFGWSAAPDFDAFDVGLHGSGHQICTSADQACGDGDPGRMTKARPHPHVVRAQVKALIPRRRRVGRDA